MPPKKMGRPLSEKPKDKTIKVRMDTETMDMLDECSQTLNSNRSDIVRIGIKKVHDGLKK